MDITQFEREIDEFMSQINTGLDGLDRAGIKILDGEFYLPEYVPEVYTERCEMLQEKLDKLTERFKGHAK